MRWKVCLEREREREREKMAGIESISVDDDERERGMEPRRTSIASNGEAAHLELEISPLIDHEEPHVQKPKMTIFTVSYPRDKSKEREAVEIDTDCSVFYQFVLWTWSGSRYSGFLCMASSSVIYSIMEFLLQLFPVKSIPLFEIIFARCTIILILSLVWLRRYGQPVLGPPHVRTLLISRALMGIQRLPLSDAILFNLSTPITGSIFAQVIFHEKLALVDIGGLSCSFLGLLLIFRPIFFLQGGLSEGGEYSMALVSKETVDKYAVLVALLSSLYGGVSYCLVRAGAKASEQPMATVLAFALFASPAALVCTLVFEDFVLPDMQTLLIMIIVGFLAFVAELFLARGLQLEKTSKTTNILFIEVFLSQMSGFTFLGQAPSFLRLVGCMLILVSVLSTFYFGPEKVLE
ncbi:solute carrier family 35 member G3 isoform X2 [Amborella trichopoda]|uniref:solute carrier family 35 member G3 isoform X2 n=1 Tax=Amborella trichopoda TaxID=13333 RepID=UPI0009BDEAA9|nr:solute carrier family 35 member G3 isoform X2 [Amborella trichopoda]|eukprot:XP_020519214.1 solute carrier family 35 member G3 isoform X2 [Amborella trichopoda]